MLEVRKTGRFAHWLDGLRDIQARARVQARIERLAAGHAEVVILLAGGDKSTQSTDIETALRLASNL